MDFLILWEIVLKFIAIILVIMQLVSLNSLLTAQGLLILLSVPLGFTASTESWRLKHEVGHIFNLLKNLLLVMVIL